MARRILFLLLLNISLLLGSQDSQDIKMEIVPPSLNAFKVEDLLNLTCSVVNDLPGDVLLEWRPPDKAANNQNKVSMSHGKNSLNMIIRNLKETDEGVYTCIASSNTNPDLMVEKHIRVMVRSKKCPEGKFACKSGYQCISKHKVCDGIQDCKEAEDERPCSMLPPPCSKDVNCSISSLCCQMMSQYPEDRMYYEDHIYKGAASDVAFYHTTNYTIIGCAMAFMFIVTILVIAICRVQMRRTLLPRYAAATRRDLSALRSNAPPLYELDVLFNRTGDLMSVNPLMVTYNINNGVQFVGRPVAPPPYCEVVAAPPREGPPPPYASDENLAFVRRNSKIEIVDGAQDGEEPKESDSLLPAPSISVISSSTIDADPVHSTYVVNLTEDAAGGSPTLTVVETQLPCPGNINQPSSDGAS